MKEGSFSMVNALRDGARRKMASPSRSLVINYSGEHRTYSVRDRELNQSWCIRGSPSDWLRMLLLPAGSVQYHQEGDRGCASITYGNLGEFSRESEYWMDMRGALVASIGIAVGEALYY